jgi:hypothetical protein
VCGHGSDVPAAALVGGRAASPVTFRPDAALSAARCVVRTVVCWLPVEGARPWSSRAPSAAAASTVFFFFDPPGIIGEIDWSDE